MTSSDRLSHRCRSVLQRVSMTLSACAAITPAIATDAPGALAPETIRQVNSLIDADSARLTAIFKDLHQHPEIAFTEKRTAGVVSRELKSLGYTVTEGVGGTGVVGVLRNGAGPTVWYRADMDANAVKEETGLPYAPQARQQLPDGGDVDVMHSCGHDAHVTWMLGAARALAQMKSAWSGTVVVYAQPAEEVGLGAQAMLDDRLWQRGFPQPDAAFGIHAVPGPVGYVASSPGVRMAGTDQLDVTFTGVGGHGSTPEMTIDPVVMAAQAVLAYQTIISRNIDPQSAAVLSVGAIEAGRDNNVIPGTAVLKLNLRWFSPEVREHLLQRIDEINRGVATAAGVTADRMPVRVMKGNAGPLVNDAALTARVNPSYQALLGADKVVPQFPSVMGSEDFQEAFAPLKTPYTFTLVGVAPPAMFQQALADGRPFPYSNHNPNFFVDLAAVPVGAKVGTTAVLSLLQTPK